MYRFHLDAYLCTSCAICVDVCKPGALALRALRRPGPEGKGKLCSGLPQVMGTFPWMAVPESCDGCELCVAECPVSAIRLSGAGGLAIRGTWR